MSREEIIKAIRSCARKLKRNPMRRDLRRLARISEEALRKHFGGLRAALVEAGLSPSGPGFPQPEAAVLLDWAAVTRKLGKIPTVHEYEYKGRFSHMPFLGRYVNWTRVPGAFARFAMKTKILREWKDVLALVREAEEKSSAAKVRSSHGRSRKQDTFQDRPCYGPVINLPGMVHEPLNEQGVIFAFAMVVKRLGLSVLRFQQGFPDCEAMREVVRGQLQRLRIEFEYESRNFLRHGHDPDGCDMIVCWVHNWKECPKHIEVIELRKILKNV